MVGKRKHFQSSSEFKREINTTLRKDLTPFNPLLSLSENPSFDEHHYDDFFQSSSEFKFALNDIWL